MYGRSGQNMYNRQNDDRAGLFGVPPRQGGGGGGGSGGGGNADHYAEQTRDMFMQDNDRQTDLLAEKVAALKGISLDIRNEVKDQNSFLDKAATDFSNTSNLLSGTVKKVQQMLASGGSKHMCHLVCFVVGVFFLLYFIMKWKS